MKEVFPAIAKESIFEKFKKIFSRFGKNQFNNSYDNIQHNDQEIKSFNEEIKIERTHLELIELKMKLKNKIISPYDLSEEQIDKLQVLFEKDIMEKQQKIAKLLQS